MNLHHYFLFKIIKVLELVEDSSHTNAWDQIITHSFFLMYLVMYGGILDLIWNIKTLIFYIKGKQVLNSLC